MTEILVGLPVLFIAFVLYAAINYTIEQWPEKSAVVLAVLFLVVGGGLVSWIFGHTILYLVE